MTQVDLSAFGRQLPLEVTGVRDLAGVEHTWVINPYPADVELAIRAHDEEATKEHMGVSDHYAPIVALLVSSPKLEVDALKREFDAFTLREVVRRALAYFLSGSLPPPHPWENPLPPTT